MSEVLPLRGRGWRWSPTWRHAFTEAGLALPVWTGREILVDAEGRHLRRQPDGQITIGIGGALIQREAPPPSRAPLDGGAA